MATPALALQKSIPTPNLIEARVNLLEREMFDIKKALTHLGIDISKTVEAMHIEERKGVLTDTEKLQLIFSSFTRTEGILVLNEDCLGMPMNQVLIELTKLLIVTDQYSSDILSYGRPRRIRERLRKE